MKLTPEANELVSNTAIRILELYVIYDDDSIFRDFTIDVGRLAKAPSCSRQYHMIMGKMRALNERVNKVLLEARAIEDPDSDE